MKVKVREVTSNDLELLKNSQLKKLAQFKSMSYTKEQLYKMFTKTFVDNNYNENESCHVCNVGGECNIHG